MKANDIFKKVVSFQGERVFKRNRTEGTEKEKWRSVTKYQTIHHSDKITFENSHFRLNTPKFNKNSTELKSSSRK